uniref:Uncharacterized protein n=1 Tax=uncultured marine virus TaxID=186617 RepID=A0A0F7L7L7_9VIRU|nr:hypothetical protein [uncultured marine virus]
MKNISDFFHNASEEEKIKVLEEAAEKANEDQRAVVEEVKVTNRQKFDLRQAR